MTGITRRIFLFECHLQGARYKVEKRYAEDYRSHVDRKSGHVPGVGSLLYISVVVFHALRVARSNDSSIARSCGGVELPRSSVLHCSCQLNWLAADASWSVVQSIKDYFRCWSIHGTRKWSWWYCVGEPLYLQRSLMGTVPNVAAPSFMARSLVLPEQGLSGMVVMGLSSVAVPAPQSPLLVGAKIVKLVQVEMLWRLLWLQMMAPIVLFAKACENWAAWSFRLGWRTSWRCLWQYRRYLSLGAGLRLH